MSASSGRFTVAISADFLKAFSRIPQRQQAKVREFVELFRSNPAASSINYEKIQKAKDGNVRSVRIDDTYRGIVIKPDTGNVYVLVWVDHHDDAYRWVENRVFAVHPETGSLQVLDVKAAQDSLPRDVDPGSPTDLFRGFKDRELKRIGIPEPLLPLVRAIGTESQLDAVAPYLPQEAAEALYTLAAGYTLQEVDENNAVTASVEPVNQDDFASALTAPDSKRRFWVVEDAVELAQMLNAPLDQWRIFLHPSQRRIVEANANGPMRVLGGAGTGKTVVAMHRAKWLAENVCTSAGDRVLFTTFTKNLAADIRANLQNLCPVDVLRKIEVLNLDAWVNDFLRRQGVDVAIAFEEDTREIWERALLQAPQNLEMSANFYKEEWSQVVQAYGVSTIEEYYAASRVGRRKSLTRMDRKHIWPVFETYRMELLKRGKRELVDCMRDARSLLEARGDILPYKAVVVDEAQDMGMEAFRLIRQMIPLTRGQNANDLFIVGDAHQRIYGQKVVLGRCGIEIRGRSRKLRINYRTTEETQRWAVRLLERISVDDLDGGIDSQKGYRSLLHGIDPVIHQASTFEAEVAFIREYIEKLMRDTSAQSICLVARTQNLLAQYEGAVKAGGIPAQVVKRDVAEDRRKEGVRLATMHRIKGLEYEHVILAGANDEYLPPKSVLNDIDDPEEREDVEISERSLVYVAATRARQTFLITYHGSPSVLLTGMV